MTFTNVKIFSATMGRERVVLGDTVTAWLAANPVQVSEVVIRQSSDASYHCLTIVVFYTV
jgi:hypothetical protein